MPKDEANRLEPPIDLDLGGETWLAGDRARCVRAASCAGRAVRLPADQHSDTPQDGRQRRLDSIISTQGVSETVRGAEQRHPMMREKQGHSRKQTGRAGRSEWAPTQVRLHSKTFAKRVQRAWAWDGADRSMQKGIGHAFT